MGYEWRHARKRGLRILEFEKKSVSWDLGLDEASRFSELTDARPVVCDRVPHVVGWDGEVSIERNCASLSLFMSKNLKLKKVNKKFRTWTNFECFGDSYMRYEHCERFPYTYE